MDSPEWTMCWILVLSYDQRASVACPAREPVWEQDTHLADSGIDMIAIIMLPLQTDGYSYLCTVNGKKETVLFSS